MKIKVNPLSPLPSVNIVMTHSRKKAAKILRKMTGDSANWREIAESALATTTWIEEIDPQESVFLVWVSKAIDGTDDQISSLLTHEAVHIKQQYLESIGEKNPGIEIEAYLVQFIAHLLFEEHRRWKDKRLKRAEKHRN